MKILNKPNTNKVLAAEPGDPMATPTFDELGPALIHDLAPVPDAVTAPSSPAAEEFRVLRAKVKALDDERPLRCIGIVSAAAGEGKSTMALGLAATLAQEPDRKILIIDCDLRKPALEKYLGLSHAAGLSEWLQGRVAAVPVRRVEPQGFFLLGPGHAADHRPELLGSERMEKLLESARGIFDFIILDCPPLVPVADSVILQDLLDGFLFVVRARHSPRETVAKALSHLKADRVRGVIFNDHREVLPGYKGYRYQGYGAYR
jgi:capsular exopolysaccharide synthesis family protein